MLFALKMLLLRDTSKWLLSEVAFQSTEFQALESSAGKLRKVPDGFSCV